MISLYLDNGTAFVWNSDDWYELRTKYRICGSLVGTISSYPRQNDFPGLPMALMPEEAALLLEKDVCKLFSLPNITGKPTDENKAAFKEMDERVLKEQTEALKKRRVEQISQKVDIIVAGKKKKLISKGMTDVQLDKETLIQEEVNKLPALSPAYVLVHLPTEHWMETERLNMTVQDLKPGVTEGDGQIKFTIFKDLWEGGHYITDGLKFGCDFLVYPADPVKFHAMYMVRCIRDQTTTFHPASLVAFGRLSVAVNKLAVLATCSSTGQINYQTLQWHESVNG